MMFTARYADERTLSGWPGQLEKGSAVEGQAAGGVGLMIEFFFDCSSRGPTWRSTTSSAGRRVPRADRMAAILVGGIFNTINPSVYQGRAHPGAGQGALLGQGPAGLGAAGGPEDQDAADRVFPVNSVKAMRICLCWGRTAVWRRVARRVFEAYWDDRDISRRTPCCAKSAPPRPRRGRICWRPRPPTRSRPSCRPTPTK